MELADWLESCGIETVAMESTGVYWIPLYELLESRVSRASIKSYPAYAKSTESNECAAA